MIVQPLSVFSMRDAYRYCTESGDLAFAGYAIYSLLNDAIIYGHNLVEISEQAQRYLPFLKRTNVTLLKGVIEPAVLQPLANLLGTTDSPDTFDSDGFDEEEFLQAAEGVAFFQAMFYCAKIRSLYL